MIRPRLRPTVSRRNKYIGVAPTAEKKLGREARRGSHDLRRLVGHANFLDVLIDNFSTDYDDADGVNSTGQSPVTTNATKGGQEQIEEVESDSDSDIDSGGLYDNSDDEEHSLCRTESSQVAANDLEHRTNVRQSAPVDGNDYFSQMVPHSTSTSQLDDGVSRSGYSSENEEKVNDLMVTASDKLTELLEDLGYESNNLPTGTMRDVSSTERPKVQRNQS